MLQNAFHTFIISDSGQTHIYARHVDNDRYLIVCISSRSDLVQQVEVGLGVLWEKWISECWTYNWLLELWLLQYASIPIWLKHFLQRERRHRNQALTKRITGNECDAAYWVLLSDECYSKDDLENSARWCYLDVLAEVLNWFPSSIFEVIVHPAQQQLLRGHGHQLVQVLTLSEQGDESCTNKHSSIEKPSTQTHNHLLSLRSVKCPFFVKTLYRYFCTNINYTMKSENMNVKYIRLSIYDGESRY